MKKIISILILSFFVISCGTFKKTKESSESNKESSIDTNKETKSNEKNKTLEPVDPTKPMVIYRDGKIDTIYNTRVIYNTTEKVIKEKSNEVNKSDLKQDIDTKEKDYSQVIETLANKFIWLIGILFVLYFVLNYIKNKTPLI